MKIISSYSLRTIYLPFLKIDYILHYEFQILWFYVYNQILRKQNNVRLNIALQSLSTTISHLIPGAYPVNKPFGKTSNDE